MHKGVYIGKNADNISERILIIGESHYSKNCDEDFTTESVVKTYYNTKAFDFFHKIPCSFGIDVDNTKTEFELFWDNVYFCNYVNELCGIQTLQAKMYIRKNRTQYNNELFDFINEHNIKKVFVFSRLVYNNALPLFSKSFRKEEKLPDVDKGNLFIGRTRDYIGCCKYLPNTEHKYTDIILNHEVTIYSLRHPSSVGGYNAKNYCDYLSKLL